MRGPKNSAGEPTTADSTSIVFLLTDRESAMTKNQTAYDTGLFVLRATLGLYLLLAGIGKVKGELNSLGSFYRGDGFQFLQPDWLPDALAAPYGYALPWAEVIVAVLLIVGLFGRYAAIAGLLMLISFTIAKAVTFDNWQAKSPSEAGPVSSNYVQIGAYLALVITGCGRFALDHAVFGKRKKKD